MYLPILRGKQFELIAIREIPSLISENFNKFSPIIEPVKENTSSLLRTLQVYEDLNVRTTLILNPIVGEVRLNNPFKQKIIDIAKDSKNINLGIYLGEESDANNCLKLLNKNETNDGNFTVIHNEENNTPGIIEEIEKLGSIQYNVVNEEFLSRSYIRKIDRSTRVVLNNHFKVLARNSDYSKKVDEFFSDDHLFYESDGFIGFSDYLTVGESYMESGFLPYAVAIHITYTDNNKVIRIRHFVSDSNDDTSDVPGKFSEALEKLVNWSSDTGFTTFAIEQLKEYYRSGTYPGLGVIKKLSIMNHIEVVLRLIS